ncbi:hypothetical protein [Schaalia cardiffensis]|uniref:hypothetical protein n=1 Tax=Schaalia cardiffensis TaxID=181487 RepID=UPI0023EFFDA7|nr:hypothetical protein [Schaalia cardiffensis]
MTTHPLDQALKTARDFWPEKHLEDMQRLIGDLYVQAGLSAAIHEDDRRAYFLRHTIQVSRQMWSVLALNESERGSLAFEDSSVTEFSRLVRAEYNRANAKHHGNTPLNPDMSEFDRAVILLEEAGEVAQALTPDADTEITTVADLQEELVQTATMAACWLQAILDRDDAR